ncbi:hypothetical protein [Sediminitomix flava]|uniref:Uncharacterized protein n=1 Tax=Sediminitomix flava TaxID=379075 RepID=A0A315Z845_SEDFL|nr:hypothetical protein [Sediminitomix flava]PWJ40221.1 hypothetical protein BC781_105289 [Sediminitomix flava]
MKNQKTPITLISANNANVKKYLDSLPDFENKGVLYQEAFEKSYENFPLFYKKMSEDYIMDLLKSLDRCPEVEGIVMVFSDEMNLNQIKYILTSDKEFLRFFQIEKSIFYPLENELIDRINAHESAYLANVLEVDEVVDNLHSAELSIINPHLKYLHLDENKSSSKVSIYEESESDHSFKVINHELTLDEISEWAEKALFVGEIYKIKGEILHKGVMYAFENIGSHFMYYPTYKSSTSSWLIVGGREIDKEYILKEIRHKEVVPAMISEKLHYFIGGIGALAN